LNGEGIFLKTLPIVGTLSFFLSLIFPQFFYIQKFGKLVQNFSKNWSNVSEEKKKKGFLPIISKSFIAKQTNKQSNKKICWKIIIH
jgi:ABC-type phosphate transport system permease subunit